MHGVTMMMIDVVVVREYTFCWHSVVNTTKVYGMIPSY